MADPKTIKQRIDDRIHMLSSSSDGERRMAFAAVERLMRSEGFTWRDVYIIDGGQNDGGKYTEAEMQELAQVARAEGVEAGIRMGMARARNGGNANGHLTLPSPAEMAEFCQARQRVLKDDAQREFIDEMVVKTRNQVFLRNRLTPATLGYLVSLYIKHGGKT